MVSRFAPLCLAVLLILAGCTGSFSSETGTTESPATETTTATATTTDDTTATVASSTTARPAHATLDADDLSAFERELLRQAVENGSVEVTRSNLTGQLTPGKDGWYARLDGELYELSLQPEGFHGVYSLGNATVVNASAVDSSDDVVAYGNLTSDARDLFDAARSGEGTETYGAKAFPDQLRDNSYVTYEGEHYALRLAVGDYVVYRLSVTEVES